MALFLGILACLALSLYLWIPSMCRAWKGRDRGLVYGGNSRVDVRVLPISIDETIDYYKYYSFAEMCNYWWDTAIHGKDHAAVSVRIASTALTRIAAEKAAKDRARQLAKPGAATGQAAVDAGRNKELKWRLLDSARYNDSLLYWLVLVVLPHLPEIFSFLTEFRPVRVLFSAIMSVFVEPLSRMFDHLQAKALGLVPDPAGNEKVTGPSPVRDVVPVAGILRAGCLANVEYMRRSSAPRSSPAEVGLVWDTAFSSGHIMVTSILGLCIYECLLADTVGKASLGFFPTLLITVSLTWLFISTSVGYYKKGVDLGKGKTNVRLEAGEVIAKYRDLRGLVLFGHALFGFVACLLAITGASLKYNSHEIPRRFGTSEFLVFFTVFSMVSVASEKHNAYTSGVYDASTLRCLETSGSFRLSSILCENPFNLISHMKLGERPALNDVVFWLHRLSRLGAISVVGKFKCWGKELKNSRCSVEADVPMLHVKFPILLRTKTAEEVKKDAQGAVALMGPEGVYDGVGLIG